jgi:hypothetical protein
VYVALVLRVPRTQWPAVDDRSVEAGLRNRMTFAALLWQAMGAANLTRAELARRVGVNRAVVGKWINGIPDGVQRKRVYPAFGRLHLVLGAMPDDTRASLLATYLRERGVS